LRIELGAKRKRSVGAGDLTKIVFDLPTSVNEDFAQSLRAYLVTQTTESWMFWYGLLETFVEEHGPSPVPTFYKSEGGYLLGVWVSNQRTQKDTMDPLRPQRLEALPGWSWDVFSDQWEEGFAHLKEFSVRVGHCRVPFTYKSDDNYGLGTWVANQRKAGPGTSATPRGTAGLVMGCLFGPVGRRFRSSERIFRACGSLPSAGYPQERQRLPTRAVD
jgi:Helicase associated domain